MEINLHLWEERKEPWNEELRQYESEQTIIEAAAIKDGEEVCTLWHYTNEQAIQSTADNLGVSTSELNIIHQKP